MEINKRRSECGHGQYQRFLLYQESGGSRLDFESIVEEVRWFVAGNASRQLDDQLRLFCARGFSAPGDQRAEILPVRRPRTLAVGVRCMMRLTRILIFPIFPFSIMDQLPLNRGALQNAQTPIIAIF
jgi:hypothetical protein